MRLKNINAHRENGVRNTYIGIKIVCSHMGR